VAALSLGLATADAHQEDADFIGEATAGEQLQWLAHHLAWHPMLAIDDLRWMAELTLNYGVETFSKGDAIKEGALRDALEAVAIGQRLSPNYTDWQRLHDELSHLLRRQAATEESTRPPEEAKEARDEEDRSPQTNGQGSQQTAADSIGMGGIAITDATLGELRKEAARLEAPKPPPARAVRATPGDLDISDTVVSDDPIRALLVKRYRMVTEEDSPGTVHRAMQGGDPNTGPAGGRDW